MKFEYDFFFKSYITLWRCSKFHYQFFWGNNMTPVLSYKWFKGKNNYKPSLYCRTGPLKIYYFLTISPCQNVVLQCIFVSPSDIANKCWFWQTVMSDEFRRRFFTILYWVSAQPGGIFSPVSCSRLDFNQGPGVSLKFRWALQGNSREKGNREMDKKVEKWYVDARCDLIAEFHPCTTKIISCGEWRWLSVEVPWDDWGWGGVVMDGVSREGWR